MDDLTRCLYEFLLERRMEQLSEDEEYIASISRVVTQEERVNACLNADQRRELYQLIDCIMAQNTIEREYLFQTALRLVRELNALVRA